MSQINAVHSGKQDLAQASIMQANRAAALKSNAVKKAPVDSVEVSEAVTNINSTLKALSEEERRFFVDEELGKMVVKIVNANTRELVRQIPTEDAINLSKKLQDSMSIMMSA